MLEQFYRTGGTTGEATQTQAVAMALERKCKRTQRM